MLLANLARRRLAKSADASRSCLTEGTTGLDVALVGFSLDSGRFGRTRVTAAYLRLMMSRGDEGSRLDDAMGDGVEDEDEDEVSFGSEV